MPNKEYKGHPAYGMVRFSRVHGGGKHRLFGSALAEHHTYITLTVMKGERAHDHGQDWYYAGQPLIEVELSSAQFAELLTSMNVGSGVPCTVRQVQDKRVAPLPDEPVEVERVRDSFKEKMQGLTAQLQSLTDKAEALLKKAPTAEERKEAAGLLRRIIQEVSQNAPFMLSQFQEASEKISTAAKAEVDAFLTHAAVQLGVKALREQAAARPDRPLLEMGLDEVKGFGGEEKP